MGRQDRDRQPNRIYIKEKQSHRGGPPANVFMRGTHGRGPGLSELKILGIFQDGEVGEMRQFCRALSNLVGLTPWGWAFGQECRRHGGNWGLTGALNYRQEFLRGPSAAS